MRFGFLAAFVIFAVALSYSQTLPHSKPAATPASTDATYRNSTFGFSFRGPFGWVDRTKEMQPDASDAAQGTVLLATFERPPQATGDTINSAVVIATEKASTYKDLKTAADYFGPLTEVTTAKGFKVANEPYDFAVGTKRLVRADFSKERGTLTMVQSTLVMLWKGELVSFTFIAGSQEEVDGLIEGLKFVPAK